MTAEWLPLREGDLDALCAAAALLHPGLPERREVFAEKLRLFPAGCRRLDAGGGLAGYALAHPWTLRSVPALDALLSALPERPDCLYIHDVAVLPGARGGTAAAYVEYAARVAAGMGLPALSLVSVYATSPLWRGLGFREEAGGGGKLASYGGGAVYMVRDIRR